MDRTLLTIAVLTAKLPEAAAAEANTTPHLLRMPEDRLCRLLANTGARYHVRVVLTDPASCSNLLSGKLSGFELKDGAWNRCTLELPDLVYDRSFASCSRDRLLCRSALRDMVQAGVMPLASGLPGKWTVHCALNRDPQLAALLAPTRLYRREELPKLMHHYPEGLFLKPAAGTHGRGTVSLRKDEQGRIVIEGRTGSNRPFRFMPQDRSKTVKIVDRIIGSRSYLSQPFLPLTDQQGRPHDVRLLVQKNSSGRWAVTGAVCRIGAAGSITSNLHGGGTAEQAAERLSRLYGSDHAKQLMDAISDAGLRAAAAIEQNFGKFAEFGFDFGLSPDGKLWLLEANSKPGRQSFNLIGDERTERLSYTRLLAYARKLTDNRMPGPTAITRSNQYFFPSDYVQEVHS